MKEIIIGILSRGYSYTQRYTLRDLIGYFYPLKYIFAEHHTGIHDYIGYNRNPFWSAENTQNRTELLHDFHAIRRKSVSDSAYFHMLNRFENGDAYGIVKDGTL